MCEHYQYLEEFRIEKKTNKTFECIRTDIPPTVLLENNLLHSQEIVETLVYKNGVKNLKLQGRSAFTPSYALMYMLFNQMFNQDGCWYLIETDIGMNLDIETNIFNQMIQKTEQPKTHFV